MLVSVRQAAQALNVSDRHLRRMIARGMYPVYRIGEAVRLDLEEIKSASRKPCEKPTAEFDKQAGAG